MNKWQDFNVNENVRVKLTDTGRRELQRHHDAVALRAPSLAGTPAYTEDAEGWSTWQLWSLMQHLGHLCYPGGPVPFETQMQIEIRAAVPQSPVEGEK